MDAIEQASHIAGSLCRPVQLEHISAVLIDASVPSKTASVEKYSAQPSFWSPECISDSIHCMSSDQCCTCRALLLLRCSDLMVDMHERLREVFPLSLSHICCPFWNRHRRYLWLLSCCQAFRGGLDLSSVFSILIVVIFFTLSLCCFSRYLPTIDSHEGSRLHFVGLEVPEFHGIRSKRSEKVNIHYWIRYSAATLACLWHPSCKPLLPFVLHESRK